MKKLIFLFSCLIAISAKTYAANDLNFVDTGKRDGPAIVFVHAFPMNQDMWSEQVEFLKSTTRVITFDIRGLGKSKLNGPYTLEFIVDDLINLLDQLKIEKAVICGLSMGGFVALRAIERNPTRFVGLVLADTKSEPDSDKSKMGRYQALKTIQDQGVEVFTDNFLKTAVASTSAEALKRATKVALSNTVLGVQSAILALTSRTDTTPGLSEIQAPTLIIHGELDAVFPIETAKALHEKIKGSKLAIIPKVGHLSNLENPAAFNSLLAQFLDGIRKDRSR